MIRIVDLDESLVPLYLVCLEDWSEEIKEGEEQKRIWYDRMKGLGLRVKIALDEDGKAGGMIQYTPAGRSFINGDGLYFINCIWVHGYKQGRGDFRRRGMGTALLAAAEDDARALGAKGIAAWGLVLPFWMRASWYCRHGYRTADRDCIRALVWKPFAEDATPPTWIRRRELPAIEPDCVTVTAFRNGWCPAMNLVCERAKAVASEQQFEDRVRFQEIDTYARPILARWGISDGLYIDRKEIRTGPPPSRDKIRRLIARRVRKLG